jgi:hypothetical protein
MPFDIAVKMSALLRSQDQCECECETCGDHEGRCEDPIEAGKFSAVKKLENGPDTLDNCELICLSCFNHRFSN